MKNYIPITFLKKKIKKKTTESAQNRDISSFLFLKMFIIVRGLVSLLLLGLFFIFVKFAVFKPKG